ncbi:hypothetical protein NEOLEDRAFT_188240 [Neolentinus lepideus HHB14362 ss-1]|uniref:Uncharacterized protein n=1 Tax=Neolentinus lepideus HHB14362 ss-1 TaxID=1314782 RepID=A0A165TQQ4_9AGAM|nr:hypothetical protein NEOLEDRAFT_188240 [Neolentinus lepideus HHB14362 ss-1]
MVPLSRSYTEHAAPVPTSAFRSPAFVPHATVMSAPIHVFCCSQDLHGWYKKDSTSLSNFTSTQSLFHISFLATMYFLALLSILVLFLGVALAQECTMGCYDLVYHTATTVYASKTPSGTEALVKPTHLPCDVSAGEIVVAADGLEEVRWTKKATSTMFLPRPTSTEEAEEGWRVVYATTSMDFAGYATSIVAPTLTSIAPQPTSLPEKATADVLVSWTDVRITEVETAVSIVEVDYSYDTIFWVRPDAVASRERFEVIIDGISMPPRIDPVSEMGRYCEDDIDACFSIGMLPGYYIVPSGPHDVAIRRDEKIVEEWTGSFAIERPSVSLLSSCPPCPTVTMTVTQYMPNATPQPTAQAPLPNVPF